MGDIKSTVFMTIYMAIDDSMDSRYAVGIPE